MDQETEIIPLDELPFEVDVEKWDAFRGAEPICPGLYLMETRHGGCFVVLKEWAEKIFSSEALAYGTEDGNAVYFPSHDGQYGDQVIRYEIGRHMALLGRPFSAYDPLYVQALYGAEEAPGYFGAPVPPVDTPPWPYDPVFGVGQGDLFAGDRPMRTDAGRLLPHLERGTLVSGSCDG